MKSIIDLEKTVLDFPSMVASNEELCRIHFWDIKTISSNQFLVSLPKEFHPTNSFQTRKELKFEWMLDFCTVLVGWDKIQDERWKLGVIDDLDLEKRQAPIFSCPKSWSLAHLMKALGAFKSVGEAKRNGWDKPIETGMNDHRCRISKLKGVVCTWKVNDFILAPGSFNSLSSEN